MIRTLFAIAALSSVSTTALAQNAGGIVVEPRARVPYVIYLDVTGKERAEIRRMIWDAAPIACRYAPRTSNVLDIRPTTTSTCVSQAADGALVQMHTVLKQSEERPFEVAMATLRMVVR